MENKTDLNEAPASVTYSVERNGFNMLFTVRADSGLKLLDQMEAIEKQLKDRGYVPQVKFSKFPQRPEVPTKPCPIHPDGKMKERKRQDGSTFWSHPLGTYPNFTGWCQGKETHSLNQIAEEQGW